MENGGSIVIDYQVSYDVGTGDWIVLESNILARQYVSTLLTPGTIYQFKVQARNAYGLSNYSEILTILAAAEPGQVGTPMTETVNSNILIKWSRPAANGSPVTSYTIQVLQAGGKYSTELANCDGSSGVIIEATQCLVPISVLTADPFNLAQGDQVFVNVMATNLYGDSPVSNDGGGALI